MDRGSYLLILRLDQSRTVRVGALGHVAFAAGHWVYVGSAMRGLAARIRRHHRKRKRRHWHIDYLRRVADGFDAIALPGPERAECRIAAAIAAVLEQGPRGFGSSDCRCPSHVFRAEVDPRELQAFRRVVASMRRAHGECP